MAVGSPVSASDADGDVLQYTHGGADMAKFKIDESGPVDRRLWTWTSRGMLATMTSAPL